MLLPSGALCPRPEFGHCSVGWCQKAFPRGKWWWGLQGFGIHCCLLYMCVLRSLSLLLFCLPSVMYLQFVAKSHLFFTAGKDNKIKQWDADKFEHIQTLEVGSFGGSWNEALSLCERHFSQELGDVLFMSYLFSLLAGASPGGVVLGTQSQRRLCSVSIPWQVPAPLGEDEGATYLGRGEGNG